MLERESKRPGAGPMLLAIGALLVGHLLAFGALLLPGREFLGWDDQENLVLNEALRRVDAESLRWMAVSARLGVYEPLSWLVKICEVQLLGFSPRSFHGVSFAMHLGSAVLLLLLARLLLSRSFTQAKPSRVLAGAFVVAGLWSLHPLRTEVVAWASGQSYAQAGLFSIVSLHAYVRLREAAREGRPGRGWFALALLGYAAAVLSKSAAVPLPVFFLALDVAPYGRAREWRAWAEKLPFALIAAGIAVMAWIATADAQLDNDWVLDPAQKLVRAGHVLASYVGQTLWPVGLVPHAALPAAGLEPLDPRFALPTGLVLIVSLAACALWRRRPWLGAAWWAYVVMLLPVLGFLQHGAVTLGYDRYTYLSTLPLCLLAGAAVLWLPWSRRLLLGVVPLLILLLAGLSHLQTRIWRDTESLWRHTLAVNPGNGFAASNLGFHLAGQGRQAEAEAVLRQGYHAGNPSLKLVLNLGTTLEANGLLMESARVYEQALERYPESAALHNNLAVMYLRTGRRHLAEPLLERALVLDPSLPQARNALEGLRANQGE